MSTLAVTHPRGIADRLPTQSRNRPSLIARIALWYDVARERRRLLALDDRMLADMGLTPEEASEEAGRPFWDTERRPGR